MSSIDPSALSTDPRLRTYDLYEWCKIHHWNDETQPFVLWNVILWLSSTTTPSKLVASFVRFYYHYFDYDYLDWLLLLLMLLSLLMFKHICAILRAMMMMMMITTSSSASSCTLSVSASVFNIFVLTKLL